MKKTICLLTALLITVCILPMSALAANDGKPDGYKQMLNDTLGQLADTLTEPQFGGEWSVLTLARGGYYDIGDEYFENYYDRVVETVNTTAASVDMGGALHKTKLTENSRLIIALSAIGKKSDSVGDWNLIAPLENLTNVTKQGLNGPIYALIALDTYGYETADSTVRRQMIDYILSKELATGGWTLFGSSADPDITSMAIQSLAPYYSKYDDVKEAVDRGINVLSSMQRDDGGYASWGSVNAESIAQVIVACTSLGIDPHTDERFVKDGNSAVDALLGFYVSDQKMFSHTLGTAGNAMATYQAAYALVAYDRLKSGKTSLYDMTDVTEQLENAAKADEVIELIAAIGTVSKESKGAIDDAREAYNALTSEQKALVSNYGVLQAAESAYAEMTSPDDYSESPETGDIGTQWLFLPLIMCIAAVFVLSKQALKRDNT